MKTILISPYSRKMRNGKENPKNYSYWKELLKQMDGYKIIQIGVNGEEQIVDDCRFNLLLKEIKQLLKDCDLFISVDNFLPHLAHTIGKSGIVLWGKSDPKIFGYPENLNLLKDRKYLRQFQFDIWEKEEFDENVFVKPDIIIKKVDKFKNV